MSKPSDRKSTFSNQEGAHILQSSHFPMPSISLFQLLVIRLPRSIELQTSLDLFGLPRQDGARAPLFLASASLLTLLEVSRGGPSLHAPAFA